MPRISKLQIELLVNAFRGDFARVATLQLTNSVAARGCAGSTFPRATTSFRTMPDSDKAAQDKLTRINRWYCEQMAYLARRLAETPEPGGSGSLLDNTLIVWTNELGKGNSHTLDNIPLVMVGGGLDFRMGRSLKYPNVPHNRLLLALAHAMGHEIKTFGNPDYCGGGPLTGLAWAGVMTVRWEPSDGNNGVSVCDVFDMDGVLIDSYQAHYQSWVEMAGRRGLHDQRAAVQGELRPHEPRIDGPILGTGPIQRRGSEGHGPGKGGRLPPHHRRRLPRHAGRGGTHRGTSQGGIRRGRGLIGPARECGSGDRSAGRAGAVRRGRYRQRRAARQARSADLSRRRRRWACRRRGAW